MHVVPHDGLWLPDELAVLETAFEILRGQQHAGLSDQEFEVLVADDLIRSARDGCYDPYELAKRCRMHVSADRTDRTSRRK